MPQRDASLVLYSRQDSRGFQDLRSRLVRLGFSRVRGLTQSELDCGRSDFFDALVFLADGSEPDQGAHLLEVLARFPDLPSLGIISRHGAWDAELIATCKDFLTWPCQDRELKARLDRILSRYGAPGAANPERSLLAENLGLNLVGESPEFDGMVGMIKKVARCDAPVLVQGETGTGKDLAARAIHYLSHRRDHPFVPVNCGALPDSLVENELFGHEKGAYTDAGPAQPGLVGHAEKGTLFLDELEALSPKGQVILLRFLQDQEYRPLGSGRPRTADVRVIAATNTDLPKLISRGLFRQDLYYRLNLLSITIAPLRQRTQDIPLLARHFLRQCAKRYGQPLKELSAACLDFLHSLTWPGNVRELENLMHRAFLLSEGEEINLWDLDELREGGRALPGGGRAEAFAIKRPFQEAKARAIREFERCYLIDLMQRANGNISQAARLAGKERRALGRLLKKHGISAHAYKAGAAGS